MAPVDDRMRELYRLLITRQVVQRLEVGEQVKQTIIQSINRQAEKIQTMEEKRELPA